MPVQGDASSYLPACPVALHPAQTIRASRIDRLPEPAAGVAVSPDKRAGGDNLVPACPRYTTQSFIERNLSGSEKRSFSLPSGRLPIRGPQLATPIVQRPSRGAHVQRPRPAPSSSALVQRPRPAPTSNLPTCGAHVQPAHVRAPGVACRSVAFPRVAFPRLAPSTQSGAPDRVFHKVPDPSPGRDQAVRQEAGRNGNH
jgi:hypothetical protein